MRGRRSRRWRGAGRRYSSQGPPRVGEALPAPEPRSCPPRRLRRTAGMGGEPSLVKTYLKDPLGLEAAVPRLNLAARERVIKPLRFLAQPREAHCGS